MAKTIDINNPRTMGPARNKRMPVTTFIRDTFFGGTRLFVTKEIDMDFRKSGQIIAPFVAKNVGGINMDRKGYETRTYEPPKIAPQRPLRPEVLEPRIPGENVHTTLSPEERQDYYMEQDAQEMDDAISRREELMCTELLTNGTVVVKGYIDDDLSNYREDTVDYKFENKLVLEDEAAWNHTNSTKYADLEKGVETILQGGYNPTDCILGQDAWPLLKEDDDFMKMLDNRRMELGLIKPELRTIDGNGLKYLGDLTDLGLRLWIYYAWYQDYDGTIKPIFPKDHVVIAPQGIGEMLYGAVTQLEEDKRYHTYEGSRVPKIFANQDNDTLTFRLSSKPLPGPFDVVSWYVLDVKG